jgi:hypothetical protein
MFNNRKQELVVIDDYFPMHKNNHAFLEINTQDDYGKNNKTRKVKQIWPILLNKAAAKLFGGYRNLANVSTATIVSAFTGGIP